MKAFPRGYLHFETLLALMLMQMMVIHWKMFSVPTNSTLLLLPAVRNDQVQSRQAFSVSSLCSVIHPYSEPRTAHAYHSGIKPFQCDGYGKKFTKAYLLKMHHLTQEVISWYGTM